jgi:hypothetical protein
MQTTAKLNLPLIAAAQAQKHITHNEALVTLDSLVQLCVKSRVLASPPAEPMLHDHYIVPANSAGEWANKDNQIAIYDVGYQFLVPQKGWLAYVEDEAVFCVWSGQNWQPLSAEVANSFGINAQADQTNRLSVKADATLLSHDDVTPGTGDHRLTLNKADAHNTASMVFQSDWSGRAEFGLTGDDDWHVKVSEDGSTWREALVANRQTGAVSLPGGLTHALSGAPLRSQIFTPGAIW